MANNLDIKLNTASKILENIEDSKLCLELKALDYSFYEDLFRGQEIPCKRVALDTDDYSIFAYFESLMTKERTSRIFISHGIVNKTNANKGFMPIILIPIILYAKGSKFYMHLYGDAIENPKLHDYLRSLGRSDFRHLSSKEGSTPSGIDEYCLNLEQEGIDVRLENYMCVCEILQSSVVINHDKYFLSNIFSSFQEHYLSKDEVKLYTHLSLHQRLALERAMHGDSFAITGALGTGKTTILLNILLNALTKDKKVLYLASKKKEREEIEKTLLNYGITPHVLDFAKEKVEVEKKEIEKIDFDKEKLIEDYRVVDEYIENIAKRINGIRIIDVISNLRKIKDYDKEYEIDKDQFYFVQKSEYDEITMNLAKLNRLLLSLPVPSNSKFSVISIKNNLFSSTEAIEIVKTCYDNFVECINHINTLLDKYHIAPFDNFARFKNVVYDLVRIISNPHLSSWASEDFKVFYDALSSLQGLDEEINNIRISHNILNQKYVNYLDVDIDEMISNTYKDIFTGNDEDKINNLIINLDNITKVCELLQKDIDDSKKLFKRIGSNFDIHFEFDDDWFFIRDKIYDFAINHYYSPLWLKRTKEKNFVSEINLVESTIRSYYKVEDDFRSIGVNIANVKAIEKVRSHIEKRKPIKHKDIQELKKMVSDYSLYYEHIDIKTMLEKYKGLVGKEYDNDFLATKFAQDLVDFVFSFDEQKNGIINLFAKINNSDLVSMIALDKERIKHIEQNLNYVLSFIGNSDVSTTLHLINEAKRVISYINGLNNIIEKMNAIFINRPNHIKIEDLKEFKEKIDNYKGLLACLDNEKYNLLYGKMYQGEETNLDQIYSECRCFRTYIKSFSSDKDAYYALCNKDEFYEVLKEDVDLIDIINSNLESYVHTYHENIGSFLYDSCNAVVLKFKGMIESENELSNYLEITHLLQVLYNNGFGKMAWDTYNGKVHRPLDTFKYQYFSYLYNTFKNDNVLNTHNTRAALKDLYSEEQKLLEKNRQELKGKIRKGKAFISDIFYFNYFLDPSKYDLILVDDAHVLGNSLYSRVLLGQQVILAGEQSYRFAEQNSFLLRFRDEDIMKYNYRYTPTPLMISNAFKELNGITSHAEHSVKRTDDKNIDVIIKLIMKNNDVKINYFCNDVAVNINLYSVLRKALKKNNIDDETIIHILEDNINITSIDSGYVIDADYNIIDYDNYASDFASDFIAWNANALLAREETIILSTHHFEEILNEIVGYNKDFYKKYLKFSQNVYNPIPKELENVERMLIKNGKNVLGSIGSIDMVVRSDNIDYNFILINDPEKYSESLYELYRERKNADTRNVTYLIFLQDLLDDEKRELNKILEVVDSVH